MTAILLTLILSFMLAAILWLVVGTRFQLTPDAAQNEVLNLAGYFLLLLPFVAVFVFFGVERI